jgi:hypothetical protein
LKGREEAKSVPDGLMTGLTMGALLNVNIVDSLLIGKSFPANDSVIIQNLFKPPQIFTFYTSDNCKLFGMIYMPYNYEHGVKYPTILYVYGGPRVQIVTNSYKPVKLDSALFENHHFRLVYFKIKKYCIFHLIYLKIFTFEYTGIARLLCRRS